MTSCIYRLDLSQIENGFLNVDKIMRRNRRIQEIKVSPFTNMLYWIEVNRHGAGHLMKSRMDGTSLRPLFSVHTDETRRQCTCPENPRIGKTLSLDQSDPYNTIIIYSDEWQGRVYQTEAKGCDCKIIVHSPKLPPTSITTDHRYIYWSNETEDMIYILKQNSVIQEFALRGVRKITAVGAHLQPFPAGRCLTARQSTTTAQRLDNTARSITLHLPKPERHSECDNISMASVQYTIYFGLITESGTSECIDSITSCKAIITYRQTIKIEDLKPFSSYVFMVSLKNYYSDLEGIVPMIGPPVVFETSAGAPSPPQNVTAVVIDPTVIEVQWFPPKELNDRTVWYEIHWRTEGTVAGVRQSGEQIVQENDGMDMFRSYKNVAIKKLVPGQLYLVWVRAYSQNSDTYSDSEGVEIETYPQPGNITLVQTTPYSLEVTWTPPVNLTLSYEVQYCDHSNTREWINAPRIPGDRWDRYFIENLSPKTAYKFRTVIIYIRSKMPYLWPQDGGFKFETLGNYILPFILES